MIVWIGVLDDSVETGIQPSRVMVKCPALCIRDYTTFERVRVANVGVIVKEWYAVHYKRRARVRNRSTRYIHKERVSARVQ